MKQKINTVILTVQGHKQIEIGNVLRSGILKSSRVYLIEYMDESGFNRLLAPLETVLMAEEFSAQNEEEEKKEKRTPLQDLDDDENDDTVVVDDENDDDDDDDDDDDEDRDAEDDTDDEEDDDEEEYDADVEKIRKKSASK